MDRYQVVKRAFQNLPGVQKVSAFRFVPGRSGGFIREINAEGFHTNAWRIPVQEADEDYLNTFGIQLIAGRKFSDPSLELQS